MRNLLVTLFSVGLLSSAAFAEIAVVVNKANTTDSLGKSDVKAIFMGKAKNFPNGTQVTPVDQKDKGIYKTFYKSVAGKSPAKMKKHWVKMTFTGKATAPKSVGGNSDVITFVTQNSGAIGYVDASAVTPDVKVVAKVD